MTTVYISIGNSDDKLTQLQWSDYIADVEQRLAESGFKVHGSWFSRPDAMWQNACWCIEPGLLNSTAFVNGFKEACATLLNGTTRTRLRGPKPRLSSWPQRS